MYYLEDVVDISKGYAGALYTISATAKSKLIFKSSFFKVTVQMLNPNEQNNTAKYAK